MRFVSTLGPAADEVFGGDARWREIEHMTDGAAKRQHVLTCYRQTLAAAGFRYLLDFELIDRRGESLYLVFGTNHVRGVEKMKDSLWEVDPVYGVGFRDPRDEQSEALFDFTDPHLAPLGRLLLKEIQRRRDEWVRVFDLREFTLHQTAFRREHVIRALTPLRDQGLIQTDTQGVIRIGTMVTAAPAH
jgi:hypothetical protein